jgi:hypothetical protein
MQAWTSMSLETSASVGSDASAGLLDVEDRAALLGTPRLGSVEVGAFVADFKLLLLVLLLLLLLLLLVLTLVAMATMGSAAQTSASMSSNSSSA